MGTVTASDVTADNQVLSAPENVDTLSASIDTGENNNTLSSVNNEENILSAGNNNNRVFGSDNKQNENPDNFKIGTEDISLLGISNDDILSAEPTVYHILHDNQTHKLNEISWTNDVIAYLGGNAYNSGIYFKDLKNIIVDGEGATFTMSTRSFSFENAVNITIKNILFDSCSSDYGGVAWIKNSNYITFENCRFNKCISNHNKNDYNTGGGVLYVDQNKGQNNHHISFIGCDFNNCYTDRGQGGAISARDPDAVKYFSIINCTINSSHAKATGDNNLVFCGGFMDICGKYVYIQNSTFENCYAQGSGGTIRFTRLNTVFPSNVYIDNCSFINSKTLDVAGSYHGGALEFYSSDSIISNCTFINCHAKMQGGAINLLDGAENVMFYNLTFINNSAGSFGGAYASVGTTNDNAQLIDCNFTGNRASEGGAIKYLSPNTIMRNCIFENNSATVDGGAICSQAKGSIVSNSNFINNTAPQGTDFYIHGDNKITFEGLLFTTLFLTDPLNESGGEVTDGYGISYDRPAKWDDLNQCFEFLDKKSTARIVLVGNITNLLNKEITSQLKGSGSLEIVGYIPSLNPIGAIFDLNNKSNRAFIVNADGVQFHNITFVNSKLNNSLDGDGGALKITANNCKVINCTFINNTAFNGGAISFNKENDENRPFTIDKCRFYNNTAIFVGSAIYLCNKTNASMIMSSYLQGNRAGDGTFAPIYYQPSVTYYIDDSTMEWSNSFNNTIYYPTTDRSLDPVVDANGSQPTFKDVYVTPGGWGDGRSWETPIDLSQGFYFVAPEGIIHFTANGVYNYTGTIYYNRLLECTKYGITLEGNGSTITGVCIKSDKDYGYNIQLINLIFANNTELFIDNQGFDNKIVNCSFINNTNTSILNSGENLKIENSVFKDNAADYTLINTAHALTVDNCTFQNNTCHLLENSSQSSVIKNSRLFNATQSAIMVNNSNDILIEYCNITNNTALYGSGGALYSNNSTLNLTSNNFRNNTAHDDGGALYLNSGAVTVDSNNHFEGNNATLGGAIYNNATLTINNAEFNKNNATFGGAIYNNATLNVDNSVFNMNNATLGGALYLNNSASIKSSSFEANTAVNGSAIYLAKDKNLELDNVVFKDNTYTVQENETYGTIYLNNLKNDVLNYKNIDLLGHNDIYDGTYYLSTIYISNNGDSTSWGRSPDEATTLDNAVKHILDNGKIIVIEESDMFTLNQTFNNLTNVTIVGNGKKFKTTEGDKYLFNQPKKH